jgi:hypothetical protein
MLGSCREHSSPTEQSKNIKSSHPQQSDFTNTPRGWRLPQKAATGRLI